MIERDDGAGGARGGGVQEGGTLPDGGNHSEDHQVSRPLASLVICDLGSFLMRNTQIFRPKLEIVCKQSV